MNSLPQSEKLHLIKTLGRVEGIKQILKRDKSDKYPKGKNFSILAKKWGAHRQIVGAVAAGSPLHEGHWTWPLMEREVGLTKKQIGAADAEFKANTEESAAA